MYYFSYRFTNVVEHWNGTEDLIATYGDGVSPDKTKIFSVTVLQVNDAPEIDDGTVSDQNVDEDSSNDVTITASDIDSDVSLNENDLFNIDDLEFTCSGEQLTCTSTDVGGVATLTIVPDSDYNKTTTVTVTVSDGELTDDATFDLTINSKNDAPILYNNSTELNEELDDQETDEEQDFVYTIYAEDIDSDVNLNQSPYDLANFTYSVTLLTNSDKATTDITNNILII